MNTDLRFAWVRFVGYILYALAGPALKYTETKGWTGSAEYDLWVGIGTAVGITAAANVPRVRQRVMGVIKGKSGAPVARIDAEVRPGDER